MVLNRRGSKNREKKIERRRENGKVFVCACALECKINCAITHSPCHTEHCIGNECAS